MADIVIEHLAADEADLRARLFELEADVITFREIVREALAVIVDRDASIKRLRNENTHLRTQLRAVFSGRTIAAERQALEDEAHEDEGRRHERRAA